MKSESFEWKHLKGMRTINFQKYWIDNYKIRREHLIDTTSKSLIHTRYHTDPSKRRYYTDMVMRLRFTGQHYKPPLFFPLYVPLSPTASSRPWDGTSAPRTRTVSTPSATTSTSWPWTLRRLLRWSHRSVILILMITWFDRPWPKLISWCCLFCPVNHQKLPNIQFTNREKHRIHTFEKL